MSEHGAKCQHRRTTYISTEPRHPNAWVTWWKCDDCGVGIKYDTHAFPSQTIVQPVEVPR